MSSLTLAKNSKIIPKLCAPLTRKIHLYDKTKGLIKIMYTTQEVILTMLT